MGKKTEKSQKTRYALIIPTPQLQEELLFQHFP